MRARQLLEAWQCNARLRRRTHFLAAKSFHRWNAWTGSLIVLLSSLNGSIGFIYNGTSITGGTPDAANLSVVSYVGSALNIVIAGLSAMSQFCQFELKSVQHQTVSEEFENLERDIELLYLKDGLVGDDIVPVLRTMRCLVDKAPLVPDSVDETVCPEPMSMDALEDV